jgi:hypothetical protein
VIIPIPAFQVMVDRGVTGKTEKHGIQLQASKKTQI